MQEVTYTYALRLITSISLKDQKISLPQEFDEDAVRELVGDINTKMKSYTDKVFYLSTTYNPFNRTQLLIVTLMVWDIAERKLENTDSFLMEEYIDFEETPNPNAGNAKIKRIAIHNGNDPDFFRTFEGFLIMLGAAIKYNESTGLTDLPMRKHLTKKYVAEVFNASLKTSFALFQYSKELSKELFPDYLEDQLGIVPQDVYFNDEIDAFLKDRETECEFFIYDFDTREVQMK